MIQSASGLRCPELFSRVFFTCLVVLIISGCSASNNLTMASGSVPLGSGNQLALEEYCEPVTIEEAQYVADAQPSKAPTRIARTDRNEGGSARVSRASASEGDTLLLAQAGQAGGSDQVKMNLDKFAQTTIGSINKCVLPSAGKKEVVKNADGSFTARYIEVDPASVSTTYKPSESSKTVTYIGYMTYTEVEYRCTAGSRDAALKGPFVAQNRNSMTELVKYVKGKWTY